MPRASEGRPRPGRRATFPVGDLSSPGAIAARAEIPPPPTATGVMRDDQELARVELMMLKGVRRPHMLMATLGIESPKRMNALIERVHARWEITGNGRDIKRHRGEALNKFDLIESELWVKWSNAEGYKAQSAFMKQIMEVSGMRNEVLGLTPKVIERLALMPDDTNAIVGRIVAQSGLAEMAGRLAAIIEERRRKLGLPATRTIEHQDRILAEPGPGDFEDDAER